MICDRLVRAISCLLALAFSFLSLPLQAEALRWAQRDGYRVAPLKVPTSGKNGFTLLTPSETGILFTNQLDYQMSQKNQNLLNGAGVAAGDFDGDGNCDLYFCNMKGANGLFRNLGDWKFTNVTEPAGVGCTQQISRAAVFADVNGDGKPDLLVSSIGGPNAYYVNLGQGRFSNATAAAGLVLKAGCHTMTLADIDGDGDLDLYIANYGETSILRSGGTVSFRYVNGKPVVSGRYARRIKIIDGQMIEMGEPDSLFLNDGHGNFQLASWTDGMFLDESGNALKTAPYDMGLSAMFRDINGDGAPDLYVCNDFQTPDRIWLNDGKGHFRALPDSALRTTSHFSMGVDFADINRDGLDDFFVSDMLSRFHTLAMTQLSPTNPTPAVVGEITDRQQARRNTLQLNRGDLHWSEIGNFAGVAKSDWSWSVVFLDVDLDGYEDLLVANGHAYDTQDLDATEKSPSRNALQPMQRERQLTEFPPLETPNCLFRNRGDLTFEEIGAKWGFNSTNVSHGICLADLDNDGDLDVIVSCLWKPPLIYRNDSTAPRIAVRLRGKSPNTQGIGAQIKVLGGAVPMQSQEIISGGRYLSGDDPMRVFAAGSLTQRMTVQVRWRNGTRSVVQNALPNHIYEIDEAGAQSVPSPSEPPAPPTLFQEVLISSAPEHHEDPFNDFERQQLLPKMLSRLGPGIAWFDLDGDGHEDLLLGTGKGGQPAFLKGDGKGGFTRFANPFAPAEDDLTGLVGWTPVPGKRSALSGLSNYERTEAQPSSLLEFSGAKLETIVQKLPSSAGPIAVADINGDGALDVFVGGRVLPGRYPEAASSSIYLNKKGQLIADDANNVLLRNVGLVSGAVWSDLNNDGWPDLLLACDWGPIRVFINHAGKLEERTRELGLAGLYGWWNGITTGDVDGDGRLDIIASNWGYNSSYGRPSEQDPLRMFYADVDGNGTLDLLEARRDSETGRTVPLRNLLIVNAAVPIMRDRFPTHKEYARAEIFSMLGPKFAKAPEVHANHFASTVFLNRGDRFEALPLPAEAQFAPAFGVNVADFDGDGSEDIFLSQNFSALFGYESRLDAGCGLLLLGNGNGTFSPAPAKSSGIRILGDQRGSAVGDCDEDGRVDLVVGQNGAAFRLFHNQSARPGLRVRIKGPPGNPDGIGATLRLRFGSRMGPAREIHGGSGYWSQDSAVQVLAMPEQPSHLLVRWPGGKETQKEIPAGVKEIIVTAE